MMNPLVSIIIPAYNKADLTLRTVDSVLRQTYQPLEILVVDDGSQDNTRQKLERYPGIRYFYKENGGACSARNFGIKQSRGEFLGFLDCDDLYYEEKVAKSVAFLQANPDVGFVHTAASFIDRADHVVDEYSHPQSKKGGHITSRLILGNFICNSTAIIRRDILNEAGFFDESIFMPADWDLWLRLSEKARVGYLDTPLSKYRVTDNYIFKRLDKNLEEELVVLEKFCLRHAHINLFFKRCIYSNLYLRHAQAYLLQDDIRKFDHAWRTAIRYNPINVKAMALYGYYLVAKNNLKALLRKKILRYGE
jgi:glycosyltransferase involved in cell wall biosynthesis